MHALTKHALKIVLQQIGMVKSFHECELFGCRAITSDTLACRGREAQEGDLSAGGGWLKYDSQLWLVSRGVCQTCVDMNARS